MAITTAMNLAYIAIETNKFEEMIDFYHNIIGLDELSYENDMVFLGNKEIRNLLLVLEYNPDYKIDSKKVNGFNFLTFQVLDLKIFKQIGKIAKAKQIDFLDQTEKSYKFLDPDGRQINIEYQDIDSKENIFLENNLKYRLKELSIETKEAKKELQLLTKNPYLNFVKVKNKYYIRNQKEEDFLVLNENNTNISYTYQGLDYVVFEVIDLDALILLKRLFEDVKFPFYFNRGKKILQVDAPMGISYWFEVGASYV